MNDTVKVSVIVPNYNHKAFLSQRLLSVFEQTFQDFEVILLDDASNDGSPTLLTDYSNHEKVAHVVLNTDNSGSVFKQWIKGIELARGDYIWIAESDDYADEFFLAATVDELEKNTKLGLVFTDTTKIDENGLVLGLVSKSKKMLASASAHGVIISKSNFAKYLLTHLTIVNASSVLFRKNALLSVDFDALKKFKNTGDVFAYVGVVLNYDLKFLPKALNYMRFHSNNATARNKKNGRVYKDKLFLFNHYLNDFTKLSFLKKEIFSFFVSFFFFSVDYGYEKDLKKLINRMHTVGFIGRNKYVEIRFILFFYKNMMYKGRPYFLRKKLKSVLRK